MICNKIGLSLLINFQPIQTCKNENFVSQEILNEVKMKIRQKNHRVNRRGRDIGRT